ncbi:MAG: hypothetical protein AB1409_08300 [Pseudomonadota bacterium]
MKRRPNVMDRLYAAAAEIVATARDALRESGERHPERVPLYMPVMISGTDLRIVIESGPSIAASNAIHAAQGRAGQTPAMTFRDATRRAADLLAEHAEGLRQGHTRLDDRDDWCGDSEVREHYEQILEVIGALNRGR